MCRLSAKLSAAGTVSLRTEPLVEMVDFKCGASGKFKCIVLESAFGFSWTHAEGAIVAIGLEGMFSTCTAVLGLTEVILDNLNRTNKYMEKKPEMITKGTKCFVLSLMRAGSVFLVSFFVVVLKECLETLLGFPFETSSNWKLSSPSSLTTMYAVEAVEYCTMSFSS